LAQVRSHSGSMLSVEGGKVKQDLIHNAVSCMLLMHLSPINCLHRT